jgi:lipopolysaccharide cholinephosphotransferase
MEDLSKYNPEGSTLRKAQLRMLEMLIEIDKICRKHKIDYWIEFGTLLGAIRHKGFIPWDDDVDICVMDKDYNHLREVLQRELPEQFVFQDTSTDTYAFFDYGRVRDKRSYCYYPYFIKMKEQGLWIDIFRYTPVATSKLVKPVDFVYRRVYHEMHHYGDVAYTSKFRIWTNRIIAYLLYPFISVIKMSLEKVGSWRKDSPLVCWAFPRIIRAPHIIFPLIEVEFEGHKFYAPNKWHEHLTLTYGDYMKIPSEENRRRNINMDLVKFYE